jgi:hypothetical protein
MEGAQYSVNDKKEDKVKTLKMIELYSFWITIHFIIFILFQNYVPKWTNPTFSLLYGFGAQLALFVLGWNVMSVWFKLVVFLWKFIMLLLGLLYIPYNLTYSAINFNLVLFLIYILVLKLGYSTNIVNVYIDSILTIKYHTISTREYILNRLQNII